MKNKLFQIISKYWAGIALVLIGLVLASAMVIIINQSKVIKTLNNNQSDNDISELKQITDSIFVSQQNMIDTRINDIYNQIDSIKYDDRPILEELKKIKSNVRTIRKEIKTGTNWADSSVNAIINRVNSMSD
jgi:predicted PurR-regulated permease PerM